MESPLFSVVGCAVRNNLYMDFYKSIAKSSNISFEIVFAGSRPPCIDMPKNFRYLYTTVKPSQCVEIAIRYAYGNFILFSGDDLIYDPTYFNTLSLYLDKIKSDKIIIGSRYKFANTVRDNSLIFDSSIPSSPSIGFAICIKRDIIREIGGIDNKLIGSLYDLDIQMRLFKMGFNLLIPQDLVVTEDYHAPPLLGGRCYAICGRHDRSVMTSCWVNPDRSMAQDRLLPVESFSDIDLLEKTQGVNYKFSRWR